MIHLKSISFILCIAFITLQACNKDDIAKGKDEFILNSESYELTKGFIINYGANNNNTFDLDVILASDEINYSDINQNFSGIGDFVLFDFTSSSNANLANGTYTLSTNRNAFTFTNGLIARSYDVLNSVGEDYIVTGGQVEVEVRGDNTILNFDVSITNNSIVSGKFEGPLRKISF